MTPTDFANDIPLDVAVRAHAGTSHVPEQRGQQEREAYGAQMANDWKELFALAKGYSKQVALASQFSKYRSRMATLKTSELHARSRCVSSMIAGPAKFPTSRAQKANNAADKRREELLAYRTRAMAEMRRALCPEDAPIMSGDDDAVERLKAKLADAMRLQDLMVASNKAIRRLANHGRDHQVLALRELGHSVCAANILLIPDELARVGYPDYKIRNNGAEIRRLRKRIEAVTVAKATPATSTEGNGVRVEDDPGANRVRLYFDEKPAAHMRAELKSHGFRWTPTLGCWQAYRTAGAMDMARRIAGGAEVATAGAKAS